MLALHITKETNTFSSGVAPPLVKAACTQDSSIWVWKCSH